jgi:hypothetical protein
MIGCRGPTIDDDNRVGSVSVALAVAEGIQRRGPPSSQEGWKDRPDQEVSPRHDDREALLRRRRTLWEETKS